MEVCRHDPATAVRLCYTRPCLSLSLEGFSALRVKRGIRWEEVVFTAGDMEVTPPFMEHWARTRAHAHVAVRFEPEQLAERFGLPDAACKVTFTPHLQDEDCRRILELLHRAVLDLQAVPTLYAEGLIVALSARVFGPQASAPESARASFQGAVHDFHPRWDRYQALQNWVDARLDQDITLEALAAQAKLNPDQLVRAFRRWRGISPYRFVVSRRLALAKELLRATQLPLGEIAHRTGFYDQSHLGRHFKREVGTSPRRYRLSP